MDGPTAHRALATALGNSDWKSARLSLERLLELHPLEASLHFTLGSVLRNEHKTASARQSHLLLRADDSYKLALEIAPTHGEAAAEIAILAGEISEAANTEPNSIPANAVRTDNEVTALHQRAAALQPASPAVHRHLGEWFNRLDDGRHDHLAEASAAFSTAHQLDPTSAILSVQLGLVEHRRGRWADAIKAYEAAASQQPAHAAAEANGLLGSLHLHRTRSLVRAEKAMRAAIAARDGDGESTGKPTARGESHAVDTRTTRTELTQVLQLQGRLDEAARLTMLAEEADAPKPSMAWALQNELTLPMYLWRHRAHYQQAAHRMPDALHAPRAADPLLRRCGEALSAGATDGLGPLVSCQGECIARTTTVALWQQCKRALSWPLLTDAPADPARAAVERHPGAPASDEGSRLHFAARWGTAREVGVLLLPPPASMLRPERLGALLRATGPMRYTPVHEAALHADCELMRALLAGIGQRSAGALARAVGATDAFGRTAIDLVRTVREGAGATALSERRADCVESAVVEAASLHGADAPDECVNESDDACLFVEHRPRGSEDGGGPAMPETGVSVVTIEAVLTREGEKQADATAAAAAAERQARSKVCIRTDGTACELVDDEDADADWTAHADDNAQAPPPPRCDIGVWDIDNATAESLRRGGPLSRAALQFGARFVRDAVSINQPVLLRGLVRAPRLLAEWTRSSMLRRAGDERFQVMQFEANGTTMADSHTWRRLRLREWLRQMRQPTRALPEYIFDQSGAAGQGALGPSLLRLFPWRALLHPEAPGLYVGPRHSGNPFHYHAQTWNALVVGRKRWLLYEPNASFYSEEHPLAWLRASRRHLGHVPLECEQRAGDVLFVPHLWGHGTVNLEESVGVAFPFALRQGVDYPGALELVA